MAQQPAAGERKQRQSTQAHVHAHLFLTKIWEGDRGVIPVSPRLRAGEGYADVGAVSERKDKN